MELIDNYLKQFNLIYSNGIKKIGRDLYTHSSNISALPKVYQNFLKNNDIKLSKTTFIKASPNKLSIIEVESIEVFEPVLVSSKIYDLENNQSSTIEFKANPPIYHHIWMMMPTNTTLIDINQHKARSVWWKLSLGTGRSIASKVGRLEQWELLISQIYPPFSRSEAEQSYTSKSTSINSKKLPAAYKKIEHSNISGKVIFDYGCGRFSNTGEFITGLGGIFIGYDPYHMTSHHNIVALTVLNCGPINYIVCSNVLNVIEEDSIVSHICAEIAESVVKHDAKAIIGIYEGDKSGVGRASGMDKYQRNSKASFYFKFFKNEQVKLSCKGSFLIIDKCC